MLVRDVMTVGVVTAAPDTPVKELAALMVGARISGIPVVEDGKVVGIVSESDLLPLHEGDPGRRVQVAADVMTRKLVTLVEGMTVTEAARVLQRHGVKRAPVMRGERLVGICTRANLLRPYLRTDLEILAEVEEAVLSGALGISPRGVRALVTDGVVRLEGRVTSARTRAILLRLVRAVDGVVDLEEQLEIEEEPNGQTTHPEGAGRPVTD
ncbi:MAG TPA: CBS domain-containing protein [Actinomycetota bacterium]